MAGSSVTGTGLGASGKVTTTELAALAIGPAIYAAGSVEAVESGPSSPPAPVNTVVLPYPLPGPADNYVIMLTTEQAGYAYVTDIVDDSDGNLTGFSLIAESEGTVMYLIARKGFRITS